MGRGIHFEIDWWVSYVEKQHVLICNIRNKAGFVGYCPDKLSMTTNVRMMKCMYMVTIADLVGCILARFRITEYFIRQHFPGRVGFRVNIFSIGERSDRGVTKPHSMSQNLEGFS